jgi:hypothetical protein
LQKLWLPVTLQHSEICVGRECRGLNVRTQGGLRLCLSLSLSRRQCLRDSEEIAKQRRSTFSVKKGTGRRAGARPPLTARPSSLEPWDCLPLARACAGARGTGCAWVAGRALATPPGTDMEFHSGTLWVPLSYRCTPPRRIPYY